MKKSSAAYRLNVSADKETLLVDPVESLLRFFIEKRRPGLGMNARIIFTQNTSTMISKSERAGGLALRIHHMFRQAPAPLLRDLVDYFFDRESLRAHRAIRRRVMDFIALHREESLNPFPLHRLLPPEGKHHDLRSLQTRVREEHFPGLASSPAIAWTCRIHRTLMGKWIQNPEPHPNLILVNRLLDHPQVPCFYLEFIIFHEFLHEQMPTFRQCGRWIHHPPQFREREKNFPRYQEARVWEKTNLNKLFRGARRARVS
ncbi:MAG: hypothetical protein HY717_19105 [Planctomycetes bacterium]|nr:hypothetical protein [Planctomycetota bacterium]